MANLRWILGVMVAFAVFNSGCNQSVLITGNIANVSNQTLDVTHNGQKYTALPNSVLKISYLVVIKTKTPGKTRRNFDCCPCEAGTLTIVPRGKNRTLTKDPSDGNNWNIVRDGKSISCDFEVRDSDIN